MKFLRVRGDRVAQDLTDEIIVVRAVVDIAYDGYEVIITGFQQTTWRWSGEYGDH